MFDVTMQNQGTEFRSTTPGEVPVEGRQQPGGGAPAQSSQATTGVQPGQGGVTTGKQDATLPPDMPPPSLLAPPPLPSPRLRGHGGNEHLNMETATILAMGAGTRTQQSRMNTLLNRQVSQTAELKAIRDERISEMLEAAKNSQKAEKAGGISKALGIFAMVASVLVTLGSLGTASAAGAALMVVGTGLSLAVGIDSMTGGKMMEKLSGGNQWVALGLSIGLSLGGAAMTMKGAAMISKAIQAKAVVQGVGQGAAKGGQVAGQGVKVGTTGAQGAATSTRTTSQATSSAANAAKGGSATAQTTNQSNQMLTGSMLERLVRMGSSTKNAQQVYIRTQQLQLRAVQVESATDIAAAVSGVPVAVHGYHAGVARAKTRELQAESTFVQARISQLNDYIKGASQQLAKNYEVMANAVAGFKNANSAAFGR